MSKCEENIFAEERKRRIVERVNRQAKTTVSDLCEEFGVNSSGQFIQKGAKIVIFSIKDSKLTVKEV